MIRFARVQGAIWQFAGEEIQIVVTLDDRSSITTVRDELVRAMGPLSTRDDLLWHADQYTQETIATVLAETGWEAIGVESAQGADDGLIQSPVYIVRNLWS